MLTGIVREPPSRLKPLWVRWGPFPVPVCRLSDRHNLINSFLCNSMSGECNNCGTVSITADPTIRTGYVVMNRSGTNDNFTTGGCCKESTGFFGVDNSNCWNVVLRHNSICLLHRLTTSIDCEPANVSILQNFNVLGVKNVVGVGVTLTPTVSINERCNFSGVNQTAEMWQVSANIVPP